MYKNHRVVVTMTSWKKRIGNCAQVVRRLLDNTLKPDIVFLNLSEAEFPNRELDLPRELVQLSRGEPTFKINWVPGRNTKTMKKVFPILPMLDDSDRIIIIDDDLDIPRDLVELRVREFEEHSCKYAISGACNPRLHLNKPLVGKFKYNTIAQTSIFTKRMLKGYDKILTDALIDTLNDDCLYSMLILSNGFRILPSLYLSTPAGGNTLKKLSLVNEIDPLRFGKEDQGRKVPSYFRDSDVIQMFNKRFNEVMPHKFEQALKTADDLYEMNLVLFDIYNRAGDNAEYLYRQVRELYPQISMTFLIQRNCADWKRLERDGFNLLDIDDESKVKEAMKKADYILFSKKVNPSFVQYPGYRSKTIFLQHGTINDIYDCLWYVKGSISKFAKYILCSSEWEKKIISRGCNTIVPLDLGMPRHDVLLQKHMESGVSPTKRVFISFHWRKNHMRNIRGTQYLKDVNAFLNNKKLKQMVDKGVEVYFLPHAMYYGLMKSFNVPSYVKVPTDMLFQDILLSSNVLVTDFSSNSFEMAYMDKPTIGYVPGEQDVRRNLPHYHIENLKKHPNITYCNTMDMALDQLALALDRNTKVDFAKKMFNHVDTNNSKRLVEWMLNHIRDDIKLKSNEWKFSEFNYG